METLTVASNIKSLSEIAEYIKKNAQIANLDQKTAYKLRLAVDEIATNIIIHGFQEKGIEGNLTIYSKIENQQLIISLEDSGEYFDPREKIECETQNIDKPLEEKPIGNLGIYLAINGVDQFIYERKNDLNYNHFFINLV